MNSRIIYKNILRNKVVSFTTVLFVTVAAMLMSLATMLTVDMLGAIDSLMADAKTPHFMQMHSGTIGRSDLEAFAENNSNVEDYQTIEFLNVDNSKITLGKNTLAGSVQDNGFCVQSERFDFLLDLDNRRISPKDGEVYVPVCYFKDGLVKEGDQASIGDRTFTVAGFVRDSQMNSALASSKRFVVSEADYDLLEQIGSVEYLIEFRLYDLSELSAFETAYNAAGLPAGGPALTWPLFKIISAVSDGIMIAVIMLVGLLVILIALLCIRFTLLAKIEEDYREIGAMKAVGMRTSDIRRIYLAIYASIAAMGCIIGFLLSLLLKKSMQESIRLNFGNGSSSAFTMMLGSAGAALVFLLVLFYVNMNLRRFHKISAVQALSFGAVQEPVSGFGRMKLSANRLLSTNLFLGIKDVLSRKRLYFTMLAVIILASFIMIVPQNLYHTISGDDFVAYIGVGRCDMRIDIQQTSQIDQKTADIGTYLNGDQDVEEYALFTTKTFGVKTDGDTAENMKIELGDHSVFPLQYSSGRMPVKENEIALSSMNAEEIGKNVGDRLILLTANGEKELSVCGIYPDITNGGKTAKAVFQDDTAETAWSMICVTLADQRLLSDKIEMFSNQFSFAKISGIEEYMAQTFGQTLHSVKTASLVAILAAFAVTLLVTLLFMKLLAVKDRYSIAVMRASGFTGSDIRAQYAWRAAFILAAGIIAGTILAGTLGEKISGMAMSSIGAAAFHFTVNPLFTYLLSPVIMALAALLATVCGTFRAGDVHIYESIKE